MRQLYRITYQRLGETSGITFSAADLVEALRYQSIFERLLRVEALTLKPLGKSKIGAKGFYVRQHESARLDELTKEEQFQQEIQL